VYLAFKLKITGSRQRELLQFAENDKNVVEFLYNSTLFTELSSKLIVKHIVNSWLREIIIMAARSEIFSD
jgi:hypothetical protein